MKSLFKFCVVGVSNTIVSFLTFYIFSEVFNFNYLISSVIGYFLGIINSFIFNKWWTFNDGRREMAVQFIKFIILNFVSLSINLFALYICVEWLSITKITSQIIAIIFSTIMNYTGSKLFIFSTSSSST